MMINSLTISSMIKRNLKKLFIFLVFVVAVFPYKIYASTDSVSLSNCVDSESARFILGVVEIKVKFLSIQGVSVDDIDINKYVCDKLSSAKEIKIEYEPSEPSEDSFGRIQAWVFVDNSLLQEDLLKNGYAKILSVSDDYLYSEKVKEAQKYAKENNLGIWKKEETIATDEEEIKDEEESRGIFKIIFDFFADIFRQIREFIDKIINNILN